MVRKLLVVGMLIVMSMAVPFASSASAGQIMVTVPKTDCLSMAAKNTIRDSVALLALGAAQQVYASRHGLAADDPALWSPEARKEYTPYAVAAYRRYLRYLGWRIVLARGPECTRSVVAFLGESGIHLISEEELAQSVPDLNLSPGDPSGNLTTGQQWSSNNTGVFHDTPLYEHPYGCCLSSVDWSFIAVSPGPALAVTAIVAGAATLLGIATNNPQLSTVGQIAAALAAIGYGIIDLIHSIEKNSNSGGLCGCPQDAATH